MTPAILISALLSAGPPADVTTLSGDQTSGTLIALTAGELSLQPDSGPVQVIPIDELLEIRRKTGDVKPAAADAGPAAVRLSLLDGSRLQVQQVTTTAKTLTAQHPLLGDVKLPMSTVQGIRFAPPSTKLDPLWTQLLERDSRSDRVVLQKGDVLDHLDGVVGAIDEATVKFLLDGDEIAVKREKAYGLIYARKPSPAKLTALVELANGDLVAVKGAAFERDQWRIDGVSGSRWTLPPEGIARVDYSLGKIVYLSALEPRSVVYTPFIAFPNRNDSDFYWKFRRDRSLEGKPLRLDRKTYPHGLAIHSKTELRYRLGGEFRRFQALLGIDDEITNTNWGAAGIRISGDRKELFAGECRPRQAPIALDLDVTNVVELDIVVDFGSDKSDIGDRIHLADARLVK